MRVRLKGMGRARACLLLLTCALLFACSTCASAQRRPNAAGQQERPRRVAAATTDGSPASTIHVRAGDNLQAAVDRARPGDTLLLEAGATFRVSLVLPRKTGDAYVTIRSAAPETELPADGERLDPSRHAARLPKIISVTRGASAVTASPGAHHYRFLFVEFGATPEGIGNIILLGNGEEKSLDELPHHIEFDRTYIHGDPTFGQRRGIALNGRHLRVVNSYFSEFKRKGDESQGICGWAGDGPFEITNNYIEASAQAILFGGGAPRLRSIVPSDITVRGNHFHKPLDWRGQEWVVKNQFELKSARRVRIDHNLMTNNWAHGQDGTAVLFTVRAEAGAAPQATIEDVVFINNIIRGAGNALNIFGTDGQGGRRLTIRNNLFIDIDGARWGGSGRFMKVTDWDGLVVENNTILNTGSITGAYDRSVRSFVFRNNLVGHGEYGFHGDGHAPGNDSLDRYFPGHVVTHNAFVGGDASLYRGRNMYPATWRQVKFMDFEGGNYGLRPESPLRRAGFGGKDIGAAPDAPVAAGDNSAPLAP